MCVCECVSFSYTPGVRGLKWSSGAQKAAFSSSPLITSQAIKASDRRCLSFPPHISVGKAELEKVEPSLAALCWRSVSHIEVLFRVHFSQLSFPPVLSG